jgi:hypothetical protein
MRIGELVALADEGTTAIVQDPYQPGCALMRARTVVDLHADHIGRQVLLTIVPGVTEQIVVLGVLRDSDRPAAGQIAGQVSLDADGERLVVHAKQQLVLRCGKASITLTKAGKVLIEGAYVLSRSTGVNRIKGGAVQLN